VLVIAAADARFPRNRDCFTDDRLCDQLRGVQREAM
jgi:hypothetical protein